MEFRIVALSMQPDLAPMVADWKYEAFGYPGGLTRDERTAELLAPGGGLEETFVLFDGDVAIGTAGLSATDLDSRPDLTPWLVGVYVVPQHRGRGAAMALVRRVEACAAARGVDTLWLYTLAAAGLYERLGWQRIGMEAERDRPVVLMRRTLAGIAA